MLRQLSGIAVLRNKATPKPSDPRIMYVNGSGVPQDYVQAHAWFNRAARSASDTDDRDRAVKSLDSMTARMTPAQIAQAQGLLGT